MSDSEKIEIKEMETKPFLEIFDQHHKKIFEDSQFFDFWSALSEEENEKAAELRKNREPSIRINLALYYDGEFAGWSFGVQKQTFILYMCNSAILPQFRRKGLYTRLLNEMMERARKHGFLEVTSRHSPNNNAVIIPKLKAGFMISGMEISDLWGTLVNLTYFPNKTRRKVMDYRCGDRPDEQTRKLLGLS